MHRARFCRLPVPFFSDEFVHFVTPVIMSGIVTGTDDDWCSTILNRLPKAHMRVLVYLICLIRRFDSAKEVTKMDAGVLSMIFSRCLYCTNNISEVVYGQRAVQKLIKYLVSDLNTDWMVSSENCYTGP